MFAVLQHMNVADQFHPGKANRSDQRNLARVDRDSDQICSPVVGVGAPTSAHDTNRNQRLMQLETRRWHQLLTADNKLACLKTLVAEEERNLETDLGFADQPPSSMSRGTIASDLCPLGS